MNVVFQIKIDTEILIKLREKINDEVNISYNKEYYYVVDKKRKKTKEFRAWDKICAIMDRLDDTIDYLNNLELNTGKYRKSAFDFYDFMNNASVVVDCIKELAKIFNVNDNYLKKSTNIFKQLGKDDEGTDEKYFEYLRSLCSVHPIETSRHRRYQDNDFECSPYVAWNNGIMGFNNDCDLFAIVYTSRDDEWSKKIGIYISQVFEYIETRVSFINNIVEEIEKYYNEVISFFKNKHIKKVCEFDNYIDYLKNLDKEAKERFGSEYSSKFDYIINLLTLKISNQKNKNKFNLYINALKYSVEYEHNALQNMSYLGFYNNGIVNEKENYETSLLSELYSLNSKSDEQIRYHYNFEKIGYLNYDSGDNNKNWAYVMLNEASEFLERYISFEGAKGDFEHYALFKVALYLHCLENECIVNNSIPNDLQYREKLS